MRLFARHVIVITNGKFRQGAVSKNSIFRSLINVDLCSELVNWFISAESDLIKKYQSDKRGLTYEATSNRPKQIKYFEYPLAENTKLLSRFLSSRVFNIAEYLLDSEVYLKSCEIHSRSNQATDIPPHQDNAYYGLTSGKALTFYIALNEQSPSNGGLKYVCNEIGNEYEHIASRSQAFSLMIDKCEEKLESKNLLEFKFKAGDCTIHHSNSIHFADKVPTCSTVGALSVD